MSDTDWAAELGLPRAMIDRAERLLRETRGVSIDDVLPAPTGVPSAPVWRAAFGTRIDVDGTVSCAFCRGPIREHADGHYCATPCAQARTLVDGGMHG